LDGAPCVWETPREDEPDDVSSCWRELQQADENDGDGARCERGWEHRHCCAEEAEQTEDQNGDQAKESPTVLQQQPL